MRRVRRLSKVIDPRLPAVLLLGVILGCATAVPQALVDARNAVDAAAADADVNRYAPVELREAQQALQQAEANWLETEDEGEAVQQAYLVTRRVEIAQTSAAGGKAAEEAESLVRQREMVLLETRTSEAAKRAESERGLREGLVELRARETQRGIILTLGDALFDVDEATLKAGARQGLDRLVTFLGGYADRRILVEVHTDSTGTEQYNLDLSQRRAEAVVQFLVENGIARERVLARGYGKAYPVAGSESATGRQRNPRVEVVILDRGEQAAEKPRPLPARQSETQ